MTCKDRTETCTYKDFHFLFNEHGVTTWTAPEFSKEVFKTELFQYNYYLPHTLVTIIARSVDYTN